MTLFRYTAVTRSGGRIEGEMEASARRTVFDQLNELGYLPVDVHEVAAGHGTGATSFLSFERKISKAQITIVTRELAMLLKSGLTLDQALALIEKDQHTGRVSKLISRIRFQLNDGRNFAEALEAQDGVFPPVYCGMVRVAEASGTLDAVLEQIAEARERDQELRSKILSATLYPSFLIVTAVGMVVLLLMFVVPRFKEMISSSGAAVPDAARLVIGLSDWLNAHGGSLLIAVLAALLALLLLWGRPAFRMGFDAFLIRVPIAGYFARVSLTIRVCRTLSTLLKSGVELTTALALCERIVGVRPAAAAIAEANEALRKGQSFIVPLDESGLFFPVVINMLKVGEETGNLAPSAFYLAQMFEQKMDLGIRRLMTILEPLIIILVSLFVAGIIIAILGAVISVNDLVI
ncbi:MAG: type II secretion system F family protein [Methyloligellaceae bacterium]